MLVVFANVVRWLGRIVAAIFPNVAAFFVGGTGGDTGGDEGGGTAAAAGAAGGVTGMLVGTGTLLAVAIARFKSSLVSLSLMISLSVKTDRRTV